jgi:uncharacterized membrane protein (DUF441 family)
MRRYIEHIKNTRTPHERRQHAMQISGVLTAGLLVVWLGTLGVRLAGSDGNVFANASLEQGDVSLTAAAAASSNNTDPILQVSTTSVYSNY